MKKEIGTTRFKECVVFTHFIISQIGWIFKLTDGSFGIGVFFVYAVQILTL